MKNQWRIIVGLVLAFIIVIFAVLNNQDVEISFGFTQLNAPLVLVIMGSAFIGAVVIALVATSGYLKQKKTIKELRNQALTDDAIIERRVSEKRAELEREYANKAVEMQQAFDQNQVSIEESTEAKSLDETIE